jgi:hypothetical protein
VPVNADLGAVQAGEVFLSHVSARAIDAVCLLMLNSLDRETLMEVIPCRCFIRMQNLSLALWARMNEAAWLFELKTAGTEIAVCLPNCRDNPAPAALVPGKAAITAMCFDTGRRRPPEYLVILSQRAGRLESMAQTAILTSGRRLTIGS